MKPSETTRDSMAFRTLEIASDVDWGEDGEILADDAMKQHCLQKKCDHWVGNHWDGFGHSTKMGSEAFDDHTGTESEAYYAAEDCEFFAYCPNCGMSVEIIRHNRLVERVSRPNGQKEA